MKHANMCLLVLLSTILVVPFPAIGQQDTSSYFPLGLWGIWIDATKPLYTGNLLPENWDQEQGNWAAINANYLIACVQKD